MRAVILPELVGSSTNRSGSPSTLVGVPAVALLQAAGDPMVAVGRFAALCSLSQAAASMASPLVPPGRTSKCRCVPVLMPEEPTSPMCCPALTRSPGRTLMPLCRMCAYAVAKVLPEMVCSMTMRPPYPPENSATVTVPSAAPSTGSVRSGCRGQSRTRGSRQIFERLAIDVLGACDVDAASGLLRLLTRHGT